MRNLYAGFCLTEHGDPVEFSGCAALTVELLLLPSGSTRRSLTNVPVRSFTTLSIIKESALPHGGEDRNPPKLRRITPDLAATQNRLSCAASPNVASVALAFNALGVIW
jgi:hypothetical protein